MAGRKDGTKALQREITNMEEWEAFLELSGILVAEIYSEWSGPCVAMASTLRRIKFEVAGDLVNYALIDNEKIEMMKRFCYTCEPIWMFIQDGKMVNFMYGSDCPQFSDLLLSEIQRFKDGREPEWSCLPEERGPEEAERWEKSEAIRLEKEKQQKELEDQEKKEKYDNYLNQMTSELCEQTAIVLLPWVFWDENHEPLNKERVAAYSELKNDLFLECFEIAEEKMFDFHDTAVLQEDESIQDAITAHFGNKCLGLRLKSKQPHPDWPVPYPYRCPEGMTPCPTRKIGDVEDYLAHITKDQPFPLISPSLVRRNFDEPFWDRHMFPIQFDGEEVIETEEPVLPAVWFPSNGVEKVEFFNQVFKDYMDRFHPYIVPEPPLPLAAFKFDSKIFEILPETCEKYENAIVNIGIYEYDRPPLARRFVSTVPDFLEKIQVKTGREIAVIIIERLNEETFLSFAGIGAYFISEDQDEIEQMQSSYFPADAVDTLIFDDDFEEEEEEIEDFGEEGEFYEFLGDEFGYGVVEPADF